MPKHDPVKVALADLVFEAATKTLVSQRGIDMAPAHEPLQDQIFEIYPISDLELYVKATGNGKIRFFSVRVSEDRS
jgi:hypothetical protein